MRRDLLRDQASIQLELTETHMSIRQWQEKLEMIQRKILHLLWRKWAMSSLDYDNGGTSTCTATCIVYEMLIRFGAKENRRKPWSSWSTAEPCGWILTTSFEARNSYKYLNIEFLPHIKHTTSALQSRILNTLYGESPCLLWPFDISTDIVRAKCGVQATHSSSVRGADGRISRFTWEPEVYVSKVFSVRIKLR